jgi:RNA polymerase sigma-70 factor (ECF subfamily)
MVADASLLARSTRGDRGALAELWRIYHPALLRYLRTRAVSSAEDVASNVWIDVGSSISRFTGDGHDFRRWLFTIAHRRSVDDLRRTARRREVGELPADDLSRDRRQHDDLVGDADDAFDAGGSLDRAIALIRRLPPEMAEAVMLRIVNDLSYADVAQILGTSEGNVRVLVHRGLRTLRSKIVVTKSDGLTMYRVS